MALSGARLAGAAVPGVLLGLSALAVLAVVGWGIARVGSGVFARPIVAQSQARAGRRLALTFDDGPDPTATRQVLDLLEARGHRGTFFVIGRRGAEQLELLAEIARRGHGVGNHSFQHAWSGPARSPEALVADLEAAGRTIEQATGSRPRWFRPPMGIVSPPVAEAAKRAGLELVGWSATGRDGTAGTTAAQALSRLRPALRPGAILVLHDAAERGDRSPIAAEVLAPLLDEMDARGLRSVPLDELLADEASATDRRPV